MTIKQLPDFAFRSATDYATADGAAPRALRPGRSAAPSSMSWSGCRSSPSSALRGSAPVSSCWSSRSSSARSTGRRGCGAASATSGSPSPSRSSTRSCPTGRRWTGVAAEDVRTRPAPERLPCPRGDRRRRHPVPVRRSPPVHQDGDPAHPPRADPVPDRRGGRPRGSATSRAWCVAEGQSLTVQPIGTPGLLLVKNIDFEAPRLRHRPSDRLHDRPGGLPGRPPDRAQDDPGQRSAVGRGLHVPPERVRAGAARRAEDSRRRAAVGRAGPDDRRGVRPAVRLDRHPGPRHGSQARSSTRTPTATPS